MADLAQQGGPKRYHLASLRNALDMQQSSTDMGDQGLECVGLALHGSMAASMSSP